jgi:hypothetical protein
VDIEELTGKLLPKHIHDPDFEQEEGTVVGL